MASPQSKSSPFQKGLTEFFRKLLLLMWWPDKNRRCADDPRIQMHYERQGSGDLALVSNHVTRDGRIDVAVFLDAQHRKNLETAFGTFSPIGYPADIVGFW